MEGVFLMSTTFGGQTVTIKGDRKKVGDFAPDFRAVDRDLQERSLSEFKEKYLVLSVVPSVDTGVCDYQTKMFNQSLSKYEDVKVITISNDLPFAQKRWCAAADMEHVVTLSDHKSLDFAMKYGTLIREHRLQARSVFILDENREIVYLEYVKEVSDHPDYDAVVDFLENKAKKI